MSGPNFLPGPPYRNGNGNGRPYHAELTPQQYFEAQQNLPPVQEDEADGLVTYWRVLWRHKLALLLAGTLGAVAGVLLTLPQAPVYQATVALEIQGLNDDFLNMRNLNPTINTTYYDPSIDIQTQVREMQSRLLMERVVNKMNSMDRASLAVNTGQVAAWRRTIHLADAQPPTVEQAIQGAAIHIKPSISSRIVEISCDSVNPKVAAQYA